MTSPSNLRTFTVTETRQAVEVTAENLDEVAAWCGGTVLDDQSVMYRRGERDSGDLSDTDFADDDDVMIKDGERFYAIPKWMFERDSEQWVEETT